MNFGLGLDGVSEGWTALQNLALLICLTVLSSEVDAVDDDNENDESVAGHSREKAWAIMWRILRAEDQRSSDTTNAT